jgi:RNA polymerase sigma-70 factor, ECF subfamily
MQHGWGARDSDAGPVLYCLVPKDLAPKLYELLRRYFRHDPSIEVIVERRFVERRQRLDRRRKQTDDGAATQEQRRRIRGHGGRRVAERRAALVAADAPALPRRARELAGRLVFARRREPVGRSAEDIDTAKLVGRIQAGDRDAFAMLYMRYFDRVYGYLRVLLRDPHAAEDVAQQVFAQAFTALPRFELDRPFWVWLFVIMRNSALNELRRRGRLLPEDPAQVDRRRQLGEDPSADMEALSWISDRELLMFIERLPLAQRQVLLLRYMLDLSNSEIASALNRSPADISLLHHRALKFLRGRLAALGRAPDHSKRLRWQPVVRKATVLRSRRFALLP